MRKYLIWLVMLFIPVWVSASSVSFDCPSKVSGEFSCNVYGTSDQVIYALSGQLEVSSGISFVSFEVGDDWLGDEDSASLDLYTANDMQGKFLIGKVYLKVNEEVEDSSESIIFRKVMFYDDKQSFSVGDGLAILRVPTADASLASLEVSNGALSPAFRADVFQYTVVVDTDSIFIGGVANSKLAVVSGDVGSKKLDYGTNKFSVVVTAESGKSNTYQIVVTRNDNRSSDNSLSSVKIPGISVNFKSNVYEYSFEVESDVEYLDISAVLASSKASFVNGYGPRTVSLSEGITDIVLKVKAENGEIKSYHFKIKRGMSESSGLIDLKIEGVDFVFDRENLEYNLKVLYEMDSLNFVYETSEGYSVEVTGNESLQVGENEVLVVVSSSNGSSITYTLKVKRLALGEKLEYSSLLKELKITDYELDFESEIFSYYLKLEGNGALEIEAIPEDESASVKIIYPASLSNGKKVSIVVTALDGSSSTYELKLVKLETFGLYIILGVVIVVLGIVIFHVKSKKKKV